MTAPARSAILRSVSPNLERAISRVQLKVRSFVYTLVAAGECVLTPEEKSAGCVLIDFGGGTTNVGVFLNGSLSQSALLLVRVIDDVVSEGSADRVVLP